ncbi:MAG: hypothetical protein PHS62_02535 [Patescibacteria group bacterium]|nr:hypothetical protein [Patescibacteria group bacterium]
MARRFPTVIIPPEILAAREKQLQSVAKDGGCVSLQKVGWSLAVRLFADQCYGQDGAELLEMRRIIALVMAARRASERRGTRAKQPGE